MRLLDDIQSNLAPLAAVALQCVEGRATNDLDQFSGQIEGVVDSAIEAHAAERIVHMRSIAAITIRLFT